nr:MAG TPA: hypothetical protein [Caudoviricetes sp.]
MPQRLCETSKCIKCMCIRLSRETSCSVTGDACGTVWV